MVVDIVVVYLIDGYGCVFVRVYFDECKVVIRLEFRFNNKVEVLEEWYDIGWGGVRCEVVDIVSGLLIWCLS